MNANVISQSKDEKKHYTGRYSTGLRKQNGEHPANVWESNVLECK